MFGKLVTATIAIITFVLFFLPGHPIYFITTSGIMGKMYSTTMMVILNNRIVLQTQDESVMLDQPLAFAVSNPGVISSASGMSTSTSGTSTVREQWTVPLDVFKIHVSIRYPSFSLPLILIFVLVIRVLKNQKQTQIMCMLCSRNPVVSRKEHESMIISDENQIGTRGDRNPNLEA